MALPFVFLLGVNAVLAATSQTPILYPKHGANEDNARAAAPQIFNALHSSMRQWGSSLNHNGMSFFPATIPANTNLYHGTHTTEPVTGTEWLAFEIEHAENFARGGPPGPGGPGGGHHGPPPSYDKEIDIKQHLRRKREEPREEIAGALHHYRTSHDMRVLYLDGMSAGKTSMGTLDTQDYILCDGTAEDMLSEHAAEDPDETPGPPGDGQRAQQMCQDFGNFIEGIVRMEHGFEIILCNFSSSLNFISATPRPQRDSSEYSGNEMRPFELIRGIGYRYHGITAGRVRVDYSHMVSAFFYDMNLTNPDPAHSSLPRLSSADSKTLKHIKSEVLSAFSDPSNTPSIDWQGVVDMIVTRYSERLQFMALPSTSHGNFLGELTFLLNMYINYTDPSISTSISRCTTHYFAGFPLSTHTDHLLYTAVSNVTSGICSTLFSLRSSLLASNSTATLDAAKDQINSLTRYLSWTTWLECGKCAYDEICFVAIWPFGGVQEHEKPSCVRRDDVADKRGYWEGGPGGGRHGGRPGDRPGDEPGRDGESQQDGSWDF